MSIGLQYIDNVYLNVTYFLKYIKQVMKKNTHTLSLSSKHTYIK
jgi:hypothetical protein